MSRTESIRVVSVRQADGVRYLALDAADAASVRRDRTRLDAVEALASLDIYRDGGREWDQTGSRRPEGREAIRRYIAKLADYE